jgi:hypothetical protein
MTSTNVSSFERIFGTLQARETDYGGIEQVKTDLVDACYGILSLPITQSNTRPYEESVSAFSYQNQNPTINLPIVNVDGKDTRLFFQKPTSFGEGLKEFNIGVALGVGRSVDLHCAHSADYIQVRISGANTGSFVPSVDTMQEFTKLLEKVKKDLSAKADNNYIEAYILQDPSQDKLIKLVNQALDEIEHAQDGADRDRAVSFLNKILRRK